MSHLQLKRGPDIIHCDLEALVPEWIEVSEESEILRSLRKVKFTQTFLPLIENIPVDSLALVHLRVFHYVQYECDSSGCSQMKTFKNTQLLLIKMLDLFSSYCIIAPFGSQCSLIVVMQWMKMIICFLNFTLLHLMCCDDGGGRNYIYKDICGPHSLCAIIAQRTKSNRLEGLPTRSRATVAPRLPSDYN